ncbi:MAG: tyrosine-type recombinase/integrase [Fibrobacterota bacterium]|nr:tyrosine-type recombinase/integrase [Fibrobacterota bacterium]
MSDLFEAHVPAFTIQRVLGHQNIATTQKYVHVAINTITSVKSPRQ